MIGKTVTLCVSDSGLKLLVAKGKTVFKWASLAIAPGLVKDGIVCDEAAVSAGIQELLRTEKVSTGRVRIGLTGLRCFSRVICVPRMSRSLLPEAIRQETERTMPVLMDQFYLSWQVLQVRGEEMEVFVVALPRDAADALVATLRRAGLKPYLMGIKPLVLARMADRANGIIVDIQPSEFDVVVLVEGVPHSVRSVSLPPSARTWDDKLPIVAQELEKTIKFYDSKHPESPLAPDIPIFSSGEMSQESQAFESLSGRLNRPVFPLSSSLKCPPGLPLEQYSTNLGLSLPRTSGKKTLSSRVDINVLPDIYRPKAPSLFNILVPPATAVVVGLLACQLLLVRNAGANNASLQARLDAANRLMNQNVAAQQTDEKEITKLEKEISSAETSYTAFTEALKGFDSRHAEVNGDLAVAFAARPGAVDVGRIVFATDGLTISGVAPVEDEVLAYASALRSSKRFSLVNIANINKSTGNTTFSLALKR